MRKITFLLGIFAMLFGIFTLTSCDDDPKPAPTVTILHSGVPATSAQLAPNTASYMLTGNARASANFKSIKITLTYNGATNTVKDILDFEKNDTVYTFMEEINLAGKNSAGSSVTITVSVTDQQDQVGTGTLNIGFGSSETPMKSSGSGMIYNWYSSNASAWDLVNNRSRKAADSDSDKDMVNPSSTDWSFKKEWYSKNGTQFVKNNSFNYNNPTVEAAAAAFSGGSTSISVSQGDIIIAKLRGGSEYAVIKVTEIRETSIENNDDYIKFEYKKK